jgi:serine/threonine protein kinase
MYASPEYAAFGAAGLKIDPYKSEAFSLGCVYYEMLSRYFLRPPIKLSRSENYSFLTVLMHDVLSEMSASLSFVRPEDIIGHPRLGDICLVEPIIELTQRLISYYHGNRLSIPRLYEEICLVPGWREGDTFYCSCQSPRANA